MLEFLKNYTGEIRVNNTVIENSSIVKVLDTLTGKINIQLTPVMQNKKEERNSFTLQQKAVVDKSKILYDILVKPWMTQKSTNSFNFMLNWNNDVPMPMRKMRGNINKETNGMYNMTLQGVPTTTGVCSVCGKTLTNPISRLYGIGPECMQKVGVFADIPIEEAESRLEEINNRIKDITWTGWIAKSAIMQMEEVS